MDLSEKEYHLGLALTSIYTIGLLGIGLGFVEMLFAKEPVFTYSITIVFLSIFVIGKIITLSYVRYSLTLKDLNSMYAQILLVFFLTGIFYEFYTTFITQSYESFYYTVLVYTYFVNYIISYQYIDTETNAVLFEG